MALWQRLSTCNQRGNQRGNVNLIQELYNRNVVNILVRHNLAEYIESRPWNRYNIEDLTHQRDIQQEFHNFMMTLKWKIDDFRNSGDMEKIMDTSKRLEEQYNIIFKNYNNKPRDFVSNMQHILEEENKILVATEADEMKPVVDGLDNGGDPSMMADLQSSLFSLSFRKVKELNARIDESIDSLDEKTDMKRVTQEELQRKTAHYQSRMNQLSEVDQNNMNHMRDRCMRTLHTIHQQITEIIVHLLTLLEQTLAQLKTAHQSISNEIDDWKEVQRKCMISASRQQPLDYMIEPDACMLADALTSCAGYYPRLRNHLDEMVDHRAHVLEFHTEVISIIRAMMLKCFIIEKQPPQVMKRDTRFSAAVRIIAGERWGFAIKQPVIKVVLVNAEQAQSLLRVLNNSILEDPKIQSCGEVLNGDKVMEYSSQTKTVHFQFKNLVLKKLHRAADRRAAELVTEEKFGVYFHCTVHLPYKSSYAPHPHAVNDSHVTLHACSLPVTVTVHGSQSPAAEATIFWDNSFAPRNRESFAHPGAHSWGELKTRISDCFMKNTHRWLNEEALTYLGMKVLNTDTADDLDKKLVSWQAFAKDTLKKPDRNFTFWEWLYSAIDLIKKHFLPMWKDNLIEGFISKTRTEALLKASTTEPHTFLLRFPDSTQGMISISYKQPDETVKHIIYSARDLNKHDLAKRILDPPVFKCLYPHHPKEIKFQKYYKAVEEEVPGYEKDLIKAHVPLEQYESHSNPCTPLQHPPADFTDDFLMESIDYNIHNMNPYPNPNQY